MKNFVQPGEIMEYSNSGSAISSGDIVVIGERIGVAMVDIAATTGKGSVSMEGVYELPKTTAQTWAQGDRLFYSSGTGKLTNVAAAGLRPAGYAFEAAGSSATVGNCKLEGNPKQATVIAAVATADGSDAATTQALANALKTSHNALLAALKAAGIMANS
jgi:predicted RecA/RadA family phage recombinase